MLLRHEYKETLQELLQNLPAGLLDTTPILQDEDTLDHLWACFQKDIEDYGLAAEDALTDALKDCLDIDLANTPLTGTDDWTVTVTLSLPVTVHPGETFEEAKARLLTSLS